MRPWVLSGPRRRTFCKHNTNLRLQEHYKRYSTNAGVYPVISVPKANVYRFGDPLHASRPVFQNLQWTVNEGESWAIVGSAEKTALLEILLGHLRITPTPPDGLYPFLGRADPPRDPHDCIGLVSFVTQRRVSGGGFYDYTARYGAVREDDRITLRESLFPELSPPEGQEVRGDVEAMEALAERLDLKRLLDLPLVALSNGQTRRARIVKELLRKPELLLLDEPLTGLDVNHRPRLLSLLREIHETRKPRILMAIRPQDPLPDWITHLAIVEGSSVRAGSRRELPPAFPSQNNADDDHAKVKNDSKLPGKELVSMQNVNVRYHERHVLKNITWTIREGDRWHLSGANGSGKTTLLSLLTGDHPQSYTQPLPHSYLILFSLPRRRHATPALQSRIGHVSPELSAAFPRRLGPSALTARDAIATGFESTFAYRPRTGEMDARIDELMERLGPRSWGGSDDKAYFEDRAFALLSPGEQSMVLLMRALVNRPSLLILDEVFSGMDGLKIKAAKSYLRDELDAKQAVVFITHWEDEVPWDRDEAKRISLDDGVATFPQTQR